MGILLKNLHKFGMLPRVVDPIQMITIYCTALLNGLSYFFFFFPPFFPDFFPFFPFFFFFLL